MSSVSSVLEKLRVEPGSDLSVASQLRRRLALLIADGDLGAGEPLPSVRAVAGRLGVSINTVRAAYRALESEGLVRTRQGAGTVVAETGPTKVRPGAVPAGTDTIGVLIAGLDPFYLPLVRGIEEVAGPAGKLVLLADTQESEDRATLLMRRLAARGIDGLIAVSVGGLQRAARGSRQDDRTMPPIVHVDQPDRPDPAVVFDAEQAGYLATRHLQDHGHRRIAMVTPPLAWPNVRTLWDGYGRAMGERGRLRPEDVIEVDGFSVEDGRTALRRLAAAPERARAVFVSGGLNALGMLDEANRLGLRVPDELAIVGGPDIEGTELVAPPLTMIRVPVREMGVEAMSMLLRLIDGREVRERRIVLGVELAVRASCGRH